jgi:hypothetical protein
MSDLAQLPTSVGAARHPRAGFDSIPRDLSRTELLRYFTYFVYHLNWLHNLVDRFFNGRLEIVTKIR